MEIEDDKQKLILSIITDVQVKKEVTDQDEDPVNILEFISIKEEFRDENYGNDEITGTEIDIICNQNYYDGSSIVESEGSVFRHIFKVEKEEFPEERESSTIKEECDLETYSPQERVCSEGGPEINPEHDPKPTHLEWRYNCDVCAKGFNHRTNFTNHLLGHSGDSPHVCSICKKKFIEERTLQEHMLIHSGDKPHKCSICMKRFTRKRDLTRHKTTHENGKTYQCHICPKQFSRASNLKAHEVAHVEGEPHKCKLCNKGFLQFGNLKLHMLMHSTAKPLKCRYCSKRYKYSCSLSYHERTHGEEGESEEDK